MGLTNSKCLCIGSEEGGSNSKFSKNSKGLNQSFSKKEQPQMPNVERAMKAALLIQRWYRRYCAKLEVRRRYTWTIFQSIEYAGEQDQMKLHNFFSALLTHIGQTGTAADIVEALSPRSSPTHAANIVNTFDDIGAVEDIVIESFYKGVHIKFPVTTNDVHNLIESFKKKKQLLHAKYVCLLLKEATKVLKKKPTVSKASTAISRQITVVGDLHGKLDDLLTILYKNGLPSTDNPYVFNGDFVDRGKKSIEVVILLCTLLLAFPTEVYLNRGNHEDMIMNARYGFCKEVNKKYRNYGPRILRLLEELYRWLPLATVIDSKVLVVHGGISDRTSIHDLEKIDRSKFVSILRIPKSRIEADEDWAGDEDEIVTPRMSRADEEWKLILDMLWSDPQATEGCCPNVFRGGGSYFGPDITKFILEQHGFSLLIRSHECKIEGYEYMHDKQCLTIFSASNYYEAGSNRGAYVTLQGPDLEPYFVQYMTDTTTKQKTQTIRERVGRMESSAIRELKTQIIASKHELTLGFKEFDTDDTGFISVVEWVKVMEERSRLTLPWRVLKDRLVVTNSSGKVDYMSTFSESTLVRKSPLKGGPTVVEALYRHKNSLETIFRLIDRDNSGYITMDEFADACQLISRQMEQSIPREEITDLANSIDINKDGKIDFNEFLECFRIVDAASSVVEEQKNKDDFFSLTDNPEDDEDSDED